MNLSNSAPKSVDPAALKELYQIWILDRLESVKLDFAQALADYRFNDAAIGAYKFLWNDFCDWYLELSKSALSSEDPEKRGAAQYVLWKVLRETVLLLHPIMPFVTAEIWSALPQNEGDEKDIALAAYPAAQPECSRPIQAAQMEFIKEVIIAIRTIKAELGISPLKKVAAILHPVNVEQENLLKDNSSYLWNMAKLEKLEIDAKQSAPEDSATKLVEGCQVIVPLSGAVNLEDELARLAKELAKLEKDLIAANKKLHNDSFTARAPAEVVAKEKERADKLQDAREKLEARRKLFLKALRGEKKEE